jgi:hypothetical protein
MGGTGMLRTKEGSRWVWDETRHQYVDTQAEEPLSAAEEAAIAAAMLALILIWSQEQARRLIAGDMTLQEWAPLMRERLTELHTQQYLLGRGGRNAMLAADRRILSEIINQQLAYFDGFLAQIQAGELSEPQFLARLKLYHTAGQITHQVGIVGTYVGLQLPAYPGVGTACKVNCRCTWSIVETATEWRATWTLHAAEHCSTCRFRAAEYRPYIQVRFRAEVVA